MYDILVNIITSNCNSWKTAFQGVLESLLHIIYTYKGGNSIIIVYG